MIGLKRGTVQLIPHQEEWNKSAKDIIQKLNLLLENTAVDIQHIGSTAIQSIHAKPIIDIAVGVRDRYIKQNIGQEHTEKRIAESSPFLCGKAAL